MIISIRYKYLFLILLGLGVFIGFYYVHHKDSEQGSNKLTELYKSFKQKLKFENEDNSVNEDSKTLNENIPEKEQKREVKTTMKIIQKISTRPSSVVQKASTMSNLMTTRKEQEFYSFFKRRLSEKLLKDLIQLFKTCIKKLDKSKIPYMAFSGTLLGIHRHHGLIDWDDKISILINRDIKEDVIKVLNQTHYEVKEVSIKHNSTKLQFSSIRYRFPFIDIFFMTKQSNNDRNVEINDNFLIRGKYLYPLIKRPFHGIHVNTPCNISGILNDLYGNITQCQSPVYNHAYEPKITLTNVVLKNCSLLENSVPFVKRSVMKNATQLTYYEDLVLKSNVLSNFIYSSPLKCNDIFSIMDDTIISNA